jgi:hypothetical protein
MIVRIRQVRHKGNLRDRSFTPRNPVSKYDSYADVPGRFYSVASDLRKMGRASSVDLKKKEILIKSSAIAESDPVTKDKYGKLINMIEKTGGQSMLARINGSIEGRKTLSILSSNFGGLIVAVALCSAGKMGLVEKMACSVNGRTILENFGKNRSIATTFECLLRHQEGVKTISYISNSPVATKLLVDMCKSSSGERVLRGFAFDEIGSKAFEFLFTSPKGRNVLKMLSFTEDGADVIFNFLHKNNFEIFKGLVNSVEGNKILSYGNKRVVNSVLKKLYKKGTKN